MISCIVCHHQGDWIERVIRSLRQSKGVEFEIIVVTSQRDLSFEADRTFYLPGEPAAKRNLGVSHTSGEFLAFFDDDVEVDPCCLLSLSRALEPKEVGMVFGKTLNMEFRNRFDEAGSYLTWTGFLWARAEGGIEDRGQYERTEPVLSGKSASCMIKRKVFSAIGGFDPWYGILAEETDLAWRVWLIGQQVLYVPSAVAWHAFNTSYKSRDSYHPKRIYYNGCRNYIAMLVTHLELPNVIRILPLHISAWILLALGMGIRGNLTASRYIFSGLLAVPRCWKRISQRRGFSQSLRVKSDQDLFRFVLKKPGASYFLRRMFRYFSLGLHG